jgi:hypothetical protein
MHSHHETSNPTLETSGAMGVFFRNLTDGGHTVPNYSAWIDSTTATVTPSPAAAPWQRDVQWKGIPGNKYRLMPAYVMVPGGGLGGSQAFGAARVLSITDRSSNQVPVGSVYEVDQPVFMIDSTLISIHMWIAGVQGGSVVTPGLGLFNTPEKPNGWIYQAAPSFQGRWAPLVESNDFLEPFTVAVTYQKNSPLGSLPPMSRLIYTVTGSYVTIAQLPGETGPHDVAREFEPGGTGAENTSPIRFLGTHDHGSGET